MRKIKFRLRDKKNNIVGYEKWYEGHWHTDNPDEDFSIDSGWWEAQPGWLYSIDGKHWTPNYIPHRYKDQFIDSHDKNGKEIYEGDILKTSTGNKQVLWDGKDGLWCFSERVPLYFASINQREVIGNIYENPELLNDN